MSQLESTSVSFALSSPLVLGDGTELTELSVREPTVKDFRKSGQQSKNAEDRELIVVALCCGLTVEDIDTMKWKDYAKLQTFLFGKGDTQ